MNAVRFIGFLQGILVRENVENFNFQFDEIMSLKPPYDTIGIITVFVNGKTLQYTTDNFGKLDWDNIRNFKEE